MQNFAYHNPTKIFFGPGEIAKIAAEIPKTNKVLFLYGGGSIKENGVYEQVQEALKDHSVTEFPGVQPNPRFETLMEAVSLVKNEKIEYILAVGGGSVVDGGKFVAAAALDDGDPWDFCSQKRRVEKALPLGAVLTLPATGSEMNMFSVVTKEETKEKRGFGSPALFPKFSVLDPIATYSLPKKQIANGVVDAFVHIMEQYLTYPIGADLSDRMAEATLLTLIENGPKALKNPHEFEFRANIMWSATIALSGIVGSGVPHDWATHMIGHELTAEFGLDHGQTLAIVLPTLMNVQREQKKEKILQYGERVWNISSGTEKERIDMTIDETRSFFETMGIDTRLSDYDINEEKIPLLIKRLEEKGFTQLGEHQDISLEKSEQILRGCL